MTYSNLKLILNPMYDSGMVFYSSLFYLPQFFQVALGYSPIRSGIFLFPVLVSQTLMSAIAVRGLFTALNPF